MNKYLCFFMLIINPINALQVGLEFDVNEGRKLKEVRDEEPESPVLGSQRNKQQIKVIDEVFTPVNEEERNIILDINDPEVQEVIKRVVSASIHEAFKNKELEKELANKKKCCTSSTKIKIALLTALSSTATAIITIALNNK